MIKVLRTFMHIVPFVFRYFIIKPAYLATDSLAGLFHRKWICAVLGQVNDCSDANSSRRGKLPLPGRIGIALSNCCV